MTIVNGSFDRRCISPILSMIIFYIIGDVLGGLIYFNLIILVTEWKLMSVVI